MLGGGSVANALFNGYECVGNYTLPLDHSVHMSVRLPWGIVGLRVVDVITVDTTCPGRAL